MALNNKNKKDIFELRKKHIYNSKLSSFEKKELFVYLNSLYRSNNITTSEMNNKFNEKFNERLKNKNREDNARKVVYENSELLIKNSNLIKEDKRKLLIFLNSLNDSNLVNFVEMENKFQEEYDNTLKKQEIINQKKQEIYNQETQKIINLNIPKEKKEKLLNYLESLNQNINITPEEMKQKSEKIIKKQEIYNQETQKIINLNIPKEKKEKLLNYLESLNQNINITPEEMKQKSEKEYKKALEKQKIFTQIKQKIINLNIPKEKKEKLLNYLESLNQNINITPEEMKQKSEKEYKKALEKQKIFTQIKQKIINLNIPKEIEKILLNYLESLNQNINITPEEMKQKSEKIIKKQEIYNKETQKIINLNIPKEIEKILLNYLESLNKNINITPEEMKQKSEKIIKKQEIYNKETQKIINLNIPKEIEKILLNYLESLNKNINITPEEMKQKSENIIKKQEIYNKETQKIINLNIPKEIEKILLNYLESLNKNIYITPEEMKQKSEKIIIKQEIYNKETQKIINLNILQEDKNELLNQLNVLNENENISSHAMEKKINDEIDTVIELKGLQPTFNIIVEHEKEQINNSNLPNEKKKELMNFLKILSNSKIFSNNEIEYKFEKKFNSYIKENDLICKKNDSIKLKKSQIITSELPNDVKNILFNYLGDLSKIEPFNIDDFNNKFDLKFQTLNYENRINLQNHIINVKKIQIKKSKLPSDKKEELYKYINSITKNEIFDIDNFNNKFDYKFIQIVKNFESKPEGYSSDQKIAISNKKKLINESSLPFNKKVELKEYVNYLTQSKSFNVDDFDKEFNVNFNQVINDYDKLIKSKSKINYNENSNLKNYQKNDIEELKYIPIDSKTITCNKCGKKLKKTHFFSKNGKYSSICKKCYEKKIATKYLEDILKYLSPNQKFDESIFLKNHPDFNAEMINTLKEQNLIDINLETNETSLTSNVVIENFFKEQNQSTYKSNINNSDNIDIKQINEKLDDIIRENLEIKKSLKEKDLEIKKLKDLIPNE